MDMAGAETTSGRSGSGGLRPRRLTEAAHPAEHSAGAGRGARVGRLAGAAAGAVWAAVRPTRNRSTGYLAVGAASALIGTSLALGVGAAGSLPQLADIGAWLGSSERGEAAHANGLTGDVDGKVKLPGMDGHPVTIAQDGRTVLVLDRKTGTVVRIDPSQLTAEESTAYGASGLQLVSGGSYAYVVDAARRTVQRIDPARTTPQGSAVDLGSAPGTAAVDPQGTLWVPLPARGVVVPFVNGVESPGVTVSAPRHDLVLTLAGGRPVVTDRTAAVTKVLSTAGTRQTFNLQGGISGSAPTTVLVPATTDSSLIPVLATESGSLALVDVATGQALNARVPLEPGHRLGTPQVLGRKVYLPDETAGSLLVYNTATSAFEDQVRITSKPGTLDLFVRNGLLWVNDEDNAAAAVVNASGRVHLIGKYRTDVPTARKKQGKPVEDRVPSAPPRQDPLPPRSGGGNSNANGKGRTGRPDPTRTPTPRATTAVPAPSPSRNCGIDWRAGCPEPMAPGTPQAESGSGGIRLTFQPASGLTPLSYSLKGAPAGASVTPTSVGPQGPFAFEVRGGSCAQQYSFTVVAHYAAGAPDKESGASAPVRPCVAPSAVTGLSATPSSGGHGGKVTWKAPASGTYTYAVAWPGGGKQTTQRSYTIKNLQNSKTYNVTVTASNAAGSGQPATTRLDLTPPTVTLHVAHNTNDGNRVYFGNVPRTGGTIVGSFRSGDNSTPIGVHCQTKGGWVTHDTLGTRSNVWDKFTWKGKTAYLSDLWASSSNSQAGGSYSPEVWQCT